MLPVLLALAWLAPLALAQQYVQASFSLGDSNGNPVYTVQFFRDPSAPTVFVNVQAVGAAWTGLGFGNSAMFGATVFVGWSNGGAGISISQRSSTGMFLPAVSPSNDAVLAAPPTGVQALISPLSGATLLYGFTLPATYFDHSNPTPMIFAMSASNGPSDATDPSSAFGIHDQGYAVSQSIKLVDTPAAAGPGSGPLPSASAAAPAMASSNASPGGANTVKPSGSSGPAPAPANSTSAAGSAGGPSCSPDNSFCFTAAADSTGKMVTITLQTVGDAWVAIGVGCNSMACDNMYIGWNNAGTAVLSQRGASGHTVPTPNGNSDAVVVATVSSVTPMVGQKLAVSFQIPASKISLTNAVQIMYAFGRGTSPGADPKATNLVQHGGSDHGVLMVNIATGQATVVSDNKQTLKLVHGCLMFIAWGILPFFTVFIARYLKAKLGHWWYLLHLGIGITILVLTLVALIIIEVSIPGPLSVRFNSSIHAYLGAIIAIGFLPLQIILGYVCNKLFSPDRPKVPWWDQAHWWLGRLTILFAWIEQFLGLLQYGSGVVIIALFVVGILCGVGVIVAGQYMFGGPVHHVKGAKGFDDVKEDVERKGTYEGRKKFGGSDVGTIRSKPSSRSGRGSDDDEGLMARRAGPKSPRGGPPPPLGSLTRPERAEVGRHGSKSSASSGGRDMSPGRRGGSPARRGGSPPRRGGAPTSPLSGGSMGVRGGRDEDRRGPRDDDKRPGTRGGPPQRRNSSPEEDRRRKEKPGRNSPPRDEDRRAGPPRGPPGGRNPPRDDDRRVVPRRDPSQSRRNEGGPRREPSRNRDEERPARRSESTKESRDPRDRSRGPSQRSNTDLRRGERDREERGGPPPQRSNSQRRRGDSPSPDGPRRGGGPPNQRSNSQRRR